MTVTACTRGHKVVFEEDQWVDAGTHLPVPGVPTVRGWWSSPQTGLAVPDDAKCSRCGLSPDQSITTELGGIDQCIAPLIKLMNKHGIKTTASCCGHGVEPGYILLENGANLILHREVK